MQLQEKNKKIIKEFPQASGDAEGKQNADFGFCFPKGNILFPAKMRQKKSPENTGRRSVNV